MHNYLPIVNIYTDEVFKKIILKMVFFHSVNQYLHKIRPNFDVAEH